MVKQVNRFWKNKEMMLFKRLKEVLAVISLILLSLNAFTQEQQEIIDYLESSDYTIDSLTISGVKFLDTNALIGISGLKLGQVITVPGEAITASVKKLWEQGLFSDIRITITKIEGDKIYLDIYLQERPRLSSLKFTGIRSSESDDLIEKIKLPNGSQVTAYVLNKT